MTDRLTLNLGVRYDLTINSFAQYGEFKPFMERDGRRMRTTSSRASASPTSSTIGRWCAAARASTTPK